MELIPILSTIILVATICTFILAIGAYILYKVREGRQQQIYATKPASVKAELVTPAGAQLTRQERTQDQRQVKKSEPGISRELEIQEKKPSQSRYTPEPRGYKYSEEQVSKEKTKVEQRLSDENKFLKYTSDGYVSPKEDRNSGAIKWR
ncbi:MAG: hypothetical protein WAV89_00615 [Ignavibacteriaceae bacterium]